MAAKGKRRGASSRPEPSNDHQLSASQLTGALSSVKDVFESITEQSNGPKWFPHGITSVSTTVKIGTVELAISVSGPNADSKTGAAPLALTGSDLIFVIDQRIGSKARGTLTWPAMNLTTRATSGDSGHAAINIGTWTGITFQDRPGDGSYCDKNNLCWFSVFDDQFGRTGIGIHPDGGVPDATAGCIGITPSDTKAWHDALKAKKGKITCLVKEQIPLTIVAPDDGIREFVEKEV